MYAGQKKIVCEILCPERQLIPKKNFLKLNENSKHLFQNTVNVIMSFTLNPTMRYIFSPVSPKRPSPLHLL